MSEVKFNTNTEKFLYEERKQMKSERDEARKELQEFKQISSDSFSVYMYCLNEIVKGIRCGHATDGATMIIKKDGHTISLNPKEIKEVVKTAGANFKR